ncbi:MAG: discoidin domain-containing protein [Clostridia bacterium]|nr:discoidin domain-containing protein [Clostridia bacterium]
MKTKFLKRAIAAVTALILSVCVLTPAAAGNAAEKNLYWPEDRVFPAFSAPEGPLVAFPGDLFSAPGMTALACLQGFANAVTPRAVILDGDVREWLDEYGYAYTVATRENAYEYIKELAADAVDGAVLYSTERSDQYMNLASSIGNTMNAVPLTGELYETWRARGIELPVLADIRDLPYTETVDIYRYLFDNYWQDCTHRILVVQRTDLPWHMRDLASAVGGAVVYLSCAGGEETALFKEFLNTMTPGESILTGWYAGQERELMTVAAQCGLSCVPADFYCDPTVFAQDLRIGTPAVPDQPELENKIYIAYFLSDGDNIQYDMHAMRGYWNANRGNQGRVAVNWTVSPALADLAPGILNYYYSGATDTECFVCGPSGMGYTMPVNTFGGNTGVQFTSDEAFGAYVRLTDRYLQRAGLRAVTIWDNLSSSQRKIYSTESPYLYGLTVQNFTNSSLRLRYTDVVNDMLMVQMTPGYFASNAEGTTPLTQIEGDIKDAVKYLKYDGKYPVFVATQVSVWAFHDIADVARLEQDLSDYYAKTYGSDVVEFVRADHFYNLYYESHGLPQDVTLKSALTAQATGGDETAILTADGACRPDSMWTASEPGEQSVIYSLGKAYEIGEIDIYHAQTAGLDASLNTAAFTVEVSADGENWTKAAEVSDNTEARSVLRFDPVRGSYVKITVTDPGADGIARIADIDIYGNADVAHEHCPKCGKIHNGNVFDKLVGFFHRIIYFLTHLFG